MAYSSQSVTSNGGLNALDITIEYRSRDDIQVFYNDTRVYLAEGKWSWVGSTDKRIQFTPSPLNGVVVKVQRVTGFAQMVHDFSENSVFTAQNLDENFEQLLDAVQEINENGTSGGGGGPGGDITASQVAFVPSSGISATNVQAAVEQVKNLTPVASNSLPGNNGISYTGTSLNYARADHTHAGSGGGGGVDGISAGVLYAYKRAISPPLDNPGDVTYNFATASISLPIGDALANGWTKTIPAGTIQLYVCVASASSTGSTDDIAANEWASPVTIASNGTDGVNGINTATVYIYRRTTTNATPALPSATVTYQFNPAMATGLNNSWETTIPSAANGEYLWVSTATAASLTNTDTIGSSEWAAVQLMARNGVAGATGSNGVDGRRGTIQTVASGSAWSDSVANTAITSIGLGGPYDRDIVTITNSTSFTQTRFRSGSSWVVLTAYIDGNLLVTGTLSAAKINGGTLSGVQVQIGSGHSPNSRAFEVNSSGTVWCDNIIGGVLSADNNYYSTFPAIYAVVSVGNKAAVEGLVAAANSSANAGGAYFRSAYTGTAGIIGPNAAAYDFYATGSGTNFGPFTGAHDALIPGDEVVELGDIVVDVHMLCRGAGVSNTIFANTKSTLPRQAAVIGVVATKPVSLSLVAPPAAFTVGYDDAWNPIVDPEYPELVGLYMRSAVNALGEGVINVVGEAGTIYAGDLICTSSVPGKGMREDSDVITKYTVAKARETVVFTGSEVKQVACVYLCG